MSRRRPESDGPTGNEWMMTFSDCMTLLLTFFVMLLSFSSFDPRVMARVSGQIDEPSRPSVQTRRRLATDSPVPPVDKPVDRTEQGSQIRASDQLEPTEQPPESPPPRNRDAYSDCRVLTVPSDVLFWGQGAQVKPEGQTVLGELAAYLRMVPSHIVISETVPGAPAAPAADSPSLRRALAILRHLAEAEQIQPRRLSISASANRPGPSPDTEPTIRIAILNPKVCP